MDLNITNVNRICNHYAGNNMKELIKIVDPMIQKIGGISKMDYDDFYSIALETLYNAASSYDETKNNNFEAYLRELISRKFKTEMTHRNRIKRIKSKDIDSLDAPISEDSTLTLGETIPVYINEDDTDINNVDSVNDYIDSLSRKQKQIAQLIIEGYELHEIREILGMDQNRFSNLLNKMRTYDKRMLLTHK